MPESLYYIQKDQTELGPLSFAQLRSLWGRGEITVRTSFRYEKESIWRPLALLQSELDLPIERPPVPPAQKEPKAQKKGGSNVTTGCGCLVLGFAVLIIFGASSSPKHSTVAVPASAPAAPKSEALQQPANQQTNKAVAVPVQPVAEDTLVVLGEIKDLDSESQVAQLKKLVQENPGSRFIAIVWRYSPAKGSMVDALLLYDRTAKQLWRSKAPNVGGVRNKPAWVQWTPVNDQKILALKAGTGFDLDGFKTGHGALPVSKEAEKFLRDRLSNSPAKEQEASGNANAKSQPKVSKTSDNSGQTRAPSSSSGGSADNQGWRGKTIEGQNWFGASSKELFEKLVQYSVQGDETAFRKLMSAGLQTGDTTFFKDHEKVLLMDTALFSGLVKVRRAGGLEEFWTNLEAVK